MSAGSVVASRPDKRAIARLTAAYGDMTANSASSSARLQWRTNWVEGSQNSMRAIFGEPLSPRASEEPSSPASDVFRGSTASAGAPAPPDVLCCLAMPQRQSAMELLAALLGQHFSAVEKLLASSIASESHDVCRLRGNRPFEVHHFWAEGLAVHVSDGVVVTVEVFGDDQPFHRRAAKAEMHPGVQFGSSREAVLAALGACSASPLSAPRVRPRAPQACSAPLARAACVRARGRVHAPAHVPNGVPARARAPSFLPPTRALGPCC